MVTKGEREADAFDAHWRKKVEVVTKIAKDYGYPEYNEKFWFGHTAGVTSLIVDIFTDLLRAKREKKDEMP